MTNEVQLLIYNAEIFKGQEAISKRLCDNCYEKRKELIMNIMKNNKKIKDKEIAKSFVIRDCEGDLVKISKRNVERIRKEYNETLALEASKAADLDVYDLPNQLGDWQKLSNGEWGFPELPEVLNKFARVLTRVQRRPYIHYIIRVYEGIDKIHWEYWKGSDIIQKIYNWMDDEFNTQGLPKKRKTRALFCVMCIRKFLEFLGWNSSEINKNFPAVKKARSLKSRIANSEFLYFNNEEMAENYFKVVNEIVDELVADGKLLKIYADGFKLYVRIAYDTATRMGIANDFDNQNVNRGRGILGIRVANIFYNHANLDGYTRIWLMDKMRYTWDKIISPVTTEYLLRYLSLHKEVYGNAAEHLFPSNDGLKDLYPSKDARIIEIYNRDLPLWSRYIVNSLFDKVNERFWYRYKVQKGNPHLISGEVKCTIKTHFFRHNFAVWSILRGLDLMTTCKRGGWNNLQTFSETYADIIPEFELSQTIEFFGDAEAKRSLINMGKFQSTLRVKGEIGSAD